MIYPPLSTEDTQKNFDRQSVGNLQVSYWLRRRICIGLHNTVVVHLKLLKCYDISFRATGVTCNNLFCLKDLFMWSDEVLKAAGISTAICVPTKQTQRSRYSIHVQKKM